MKLEWNDSKRRINLRKHGVDFADLDLVFVGQTTTTEDTRASYGEIRFITFGFLVGRVVQIVHTERGDRIRIISARKATKYETERFLTEIGY